MRTLGYEERAGGHDHRRHASHRTALGSVASEIDAAVPTFAVPRSGSETLASETLATELGATDGGERRRSPTSTVLPRIESDSGGSLKLSYPLRARYESQRILGEGGMGTVALAVDHDIERKVALKTIRPEASTGAGLARFAEEVKTVGSLEHPNIVPVHDVGVDSEGRFFFVMKYIEGETLEAVIDRLLAGDPAAHRRFTLEVRVQIAIGVLRALAYAHDRGIVHRDIKPANIMVGPYGEVVLMDWGIARPIAGYDLDAPRGEWDPPSSERPLSESGKRRRLIETGAERLLGTPAYMSPEQARGLPDLDGRSDLYSLGVVLHELLTLRHYLRERSNLAALLDGVLTQDLPSLGLENYPQSRFGRVPVEYIYFLKRATQKDRALRWPSAKAMITELEAILAGRIRVQCHATLAKRMAVESARFVDRNPHLGFAAMVGGAAIMLAGLYSLMALVR